MQSQLKKAKVTLYPHSHTIPSQLITQMEKKNGQDTRINSKNIDCLIQHGHEIKQWNAIKLNIVGANKDGLVKVIGEISFPHLKKLWIASNKILSVEVLGRVRAQNLKILTIRYNNHHLESNKIMTVSELRKLLSQKIQEIWMDANPINNCQCLTEANWFKLGKCQIPESQRNMSFFAKLKHKNNNDEEYYLSIDDQSRITEENVIRSIIRKYYHRQSVRIYTKDGGYTKVSSPND